MVALQSKMTPEKFEVIISGATEIWDVECKLEFLDNRRVCLLRMTEDKFPYLMRQRLLGMFGELLGWMVRERVHPSLGSMLNSLSRILRPNQPNARVIFAR